MSALLDIADYFGIRRAPLAFAAVSTAARVASEEHNRTGLGGSSWTTAEECPVNHFRVSIGWREFLDGRVRRVDLSAKEWENTGDSPWEKVLPSVWWWEKSAALGPLLLLGSVGQWEWPLEQLAPVLPHVVAVVCNMKRLPTDFFAAEWRSLRVFCTQLGSPVREVSPGKGLELLECVSLLWSRKKADLSFLRHCPNLRDLEVEHVDDASVLTDIGKTLRRLRCYGVSPAAVHTWLPSCTGLRRLGLSWTVEAAVLADCLRRLKELEDVDCSCVTLTNVDEASARLLGEALSSLPLTVFQPGRTFGDCLPYLHSPTAREINFYEVKLTDLHVVEHFPAVEDLSLCLPDTTADLLPLLSLVHLKKLLLLKGAMRDVSCLAACQGLVSLHLGYMSDVAEESLHFIADLPLLKRLVLEIDLSSLSFLESCPSLESVGLTSGLDSIAPLARIPTLRKVSLIGGTCDLEGIQGAPWTSLRMLFCTPPDLSPIATLPQLKELSLTQVEATTFDWLRGCTRLEKFTFGGETTYFDPSILDELPCLTERYC
ncbi:hypothetical protein AGDE_13300 [Angomonas deanei]|nr:hypothetical protein AGDE_13300 [Angomonas deanei]|eukprot:EPY22469.1 hypothetical protein AGDE_13300 [Angomonas deanei]